MRKQKLWRPALAVATLGALVPGAAAGQDRLPAATGSSQSAAFRPQGFPAGGFRIYPTLRLSTDYDDNISRSNDNGRGDGSFIIAPTVAARSNWSSHQLNADAYYRSTHYFKRTEQDHDEYGANASGRLDVMRTTRVNGNVGYARMAERRGTPGDLFISNRLIRYDTYDAKGQVSHQFNRIGVTAGAGTAGYRYDDTEAQGVVIDQQFRNRDISTANGRIDYQYSAFTSIFVSGSYNDTNYSRARPTFNRSSKGFNVLGGVRFELSRLLSGQIGVGYIRQNFTDDRFSDFSGANYDLSINYRPTELTSFSLTAGRSLTDSALFQVVGVLTNDINISVEHELLRNLLLQGSAGYSHYTYRGISRNDNRYNLGVGARYRMNRLISAVLSGDRVTQDSGDVAGRNYASNRVTLSLLLAR